MSVFNSLEAFGAPEVNPGINRWELQGGRFLAPGEDRLAAQVVSSLSLEQCPWRLDEHITDSQTLDPGEL